MGGKTMTHNELKLQQDCVKFLTYRYSHLVWNHSPNEGKRTKAQGGILKSMGMTKGFPDLEIFGPEGPVFIEFKTDKGKQENEQIVVQERLEKLGYEYIIVRDYFTFIDICHEHFGPEQDPDREQLKKILGYE